MTVRTCLNLFWMRRSVWTWGRLGWVNVGGDELGQMQRRRYGLKKTENLRFLHSIGCHSLSFCAHIGLCSDLRLRRFPPPKDKVLETFPRMLEFLRA